MTSDAGTPAPRHSGVFFPPPLIYALGVVAGLGLQRVWPLPLVPAAFARVAGWACVGGFALTALNGVARFVRAGTSLVPIQPSRVLVTSGPYAFTRNPMYLGLVLLHAGIGLLLRQPWVLIMLVPVIAVVDRTVIAPEERYLAARFGDEYRAYRARVRRWL